MQVPIGTDYNAQNWRFVGTCECDECDGHGVQGDPDYSDLACPICKGQGEVWELEELEQGNDFPTEGPLTSEQHRYKLNQMVWIIRNPRQPWTIGKLGKVARLMDEPNPWDFQGEGPYYYLFVDHSSCSSSGCVLPESYLTDTPRDATAYTAEVQR